MVTRLFAARRAAFDRTHTLAAMSTTPPAPIGPAPVAPIKPTRLSRPTGDVDDPYYWLADRDDADTIAYLEAENAHGNAWFAPHEQLIETIFGEIKSRIQETDQSVPTLKDGQRLFCRDRRNWTVLDAKRAKVAEGRLEEKVPVLVSGVNRLSFTSAASDRAQVKLVKVYK